MMGSALSVAAFAQSPRLATAEAMIPSSDPSIKLYICNKHPEGGDVILPRTRRCSFHSWLLHILRKRASRPAIEGVSMMDLIARRGFDVYLASTYDPVGDRLVPRKWIRPPRRISRLRLRMRPAPISARRSTMFWLCAASQNSDLMGLVLGHIGIAGAYTAQHNDKVNRLVLLRAGLECFNLRSSHRQTRSRPIAWWRRTRRKRAGSRASLENKQATLILTGVFDQWWNATLATDPIGSKMDPPRLRAANGVTAEFVNYWRAGKSFYDPVMALGLIRITCGSPTCWRAWVSLTSTVPNSSG